MPPDFHGFVGRSNVMRKLYQQIREYAKILTPIVIQGETGTGKELCARAISQIVAPNGPFVPVNCGGFSPTLVDSALFGHERGAFTGARKKRKGFISQAHGGLLFLDELAELPLEVQTRLLRMMDGRGFRRLGGERIIRSDFRIVAATQRSLEELVQEGQLREDFRFRLGSARIRVPPLSDRKEDIRLLSEHFLMQFRQKSGRENPKRCSSAAADLLELADWPGNVRQLEYVVSAAAAVSEGEEVHPDAVLRFHSLTVRSAEEPSDLRSLEDATGRAQWNQILRAIERTGGNKLEAAKLLGIHESTLHRKLRELRDRFGPLPSGAENLA